MVAAKAYEKFNNQHESSGIQIHTPYTKIGTFSDLKDMRNQLDYKVVKVPYLNAAKGVFPISNESEKTKFFEEAHHYE